MEKPLLYWILGASVVNFALMGIDKHRAKRGRWRIREKHMITDFTDRRPALSALLIVFLFTVVPGAFLFLGELFGDGGISTKIE